MRYVTDDNITVQTGDRVYNYYDMRPGVIGESNGYDDQPDSPNYGWFTFVGDDGRRSTLNGQRICSMAFAASEGWPGADGTDDASP